MDKDKVAPHRQKKIMSYRPLELYGTHDNKLKKKRLPATRKDIFDKQLEDGLGVHISTTDLNSTLPLLELQSS